MKHTLKYIFSFCLLLFLFVAKGQDSIVNPKSLERIKKVGELASVTVIKDEDLVNKSKSDSIVPVKKDRYGLRVGVDVYRLTRGLYDSNYKGIEFVGDFRLTKKYFLAAEIGSERKINDDVRLNSTTTGTYLKGGFDYNGYQNWLDMENIISVGLRGGLSSFSHELNSYKTYNPNPYWGEQPWVNTAATYKGLTAAWLEVVVGLKVKVINNIFAGFSFRINTLLFQKKPGADFENLYIPGFNRTYAGNFGAGFNYTITYFVPLYKKKVVAKKA